ncbi:Odorant receptor Or1 [Papilio xuthus]|uniref:Odorant receptor Or1 n=1 Tax=Papilio xuthus TaxID=66420 RepID=A0A194PVV3_PAPXU|nr:Odorant receptor Or1 [Papilio xuthus]
MMMLQYLFLLFQIIYIIQVWGDLEAVSQASYLLFTQACLCLKVSVFQVNKSMVRELLERMNGDIFKSFCDEHDRMPVKPEYYLQYELGYAFQLVTICMSAYMYFGVDSVALSMVIFGCAQIDIIKDKILKIKSLKNFENSERNKYSKENYLKLIECIKQHQGVVSFTKLVEDAFHTFLFFQLIGSVGLICMSALRISVVDWRSLQFASIVTYLLVMISQLFVSCWCGHELTATSEDLHTVLYKCAWYEQDVKFKRALYFVMMRMSRPIVLKAGHYVTLSRQTFVSILRMSYSYFAVLNQRK